MPPPHLKATDSQIVDALNLTGGEYAGAAIRVGMSRSGLLRRVERSPYLKKAKEEATKAAVEVARTCLFELVKQRHFPAIKFMLEHKDPDFRPKIEFVGDNKTVRSPEEIEAELGSVIKQLGYTKAATE